MATEIKLDAVASLMESFGPDEPLFVVNLLKYRERAMYPEDSPLAGSTGREAYFSHYLPAFASVNVGRDISPIWLGAVAGILVGEDREQWDDVAIVRYPSFSVFVEAATSQPYADQAEPHRLAALENLRLIATKEAQLPG